MDQVFFKNIMNKYESLRDTAKNELSLRQEEIYEKIPRIKEIDNQIGSSSINITKLILADTKNSTKLIEELHQNTIDLQMEKGELLSVNNYPTDYLTIKYTCKICLDTGFVDNQKCSCFKQKIINYLYKQSNLSNLLSSQNFDTFDFIYYSDKIDKEHKESPKQNMQNIYKTCLDFSKNFDKSFRNLLFTGTTGLGKTFLSSCIAKDLLDKGKTVYYQTAFKIFDLLEEYQFNKSTNFNKEDLNMLFDTDLLIIDDLGAEFINSYTKSEFFNIINSRILNNKKTIISTNFNMNELLSMYSERVASRIVENYEILDFFGDDIRIKKNLL